MDKVMDDYFVETHRWEQTAALELQHSRRRAWWVALSGCAVSVLLGTGLLLMLPLKRVEPYIVRVDTTTGVIDVVPSYSGQADLPETVTRHLVTEYVIARERYVPSLAESDYETIGALQSAPMNQAWAALWVKSNPESPLTRYGTEGHVTARIQAVTFLNRSRHEPQILQVRFQTALQRSPGAAEEIHHYIATLRVAFGAASSDAHLRALNPLGFKVLEYRREPEVLTALDAGASSHDEPQGALP